MPPRGVELYRKLLQAHRKHLPPQMRQLGDAYVRSEFKLHKNAQEQHLTGFFNEWDKYLNQIELTARAQASVSGGSLEEEQQQRPTSPQGNVFQHGSDLPPDVQLSDEQRLQLERLREEAAKAGKG